MNEGYFSINDMIAEIKISSHEFLAGWKQNRTTTLNLLLVNQPFLFLFSILLSLFIRCGLKESRLEHIYFDWKIWSLNS